MERNTYVLQGNENIGSVQIADDVIAVIAGLATEGITIIDDIVYIQRGYERFEEKLRGLGGLIERVASEKEIQKFKLKVG